MRSQNYAIFWGTVVTLLGMAAVPSDGAQDAIDAISRGVSIYSACDSDQTIDAVSRAVTIYNQCASDDFEDAISGAVAVYNQCVSEAVTDAVSREVSVVRDLPVDFNHDFEINLTDLAILLSNFGTPSGMARCNGDVDCDADVDLIDLATVLSFFGGVCYEVTAPSCE